MAESIDAASITSLAFIASDLDVTNHVDIDSSALLPFVSSAMDVTNTVDVATAAPLAFTSSSINLVEHNEVDVDVASTVPLASATIALHAVDFDPDFLVLTDAKTDPIVILAPESDEVVSPSGGGLIEDSSVTEKLNVISFIIDDVAREYLEVYDSNRWPEGTIPDYLANQWNEGTFVYPYTPNLDRLARNGLLLARMHSAAMCSPTRAAAITGRNNQQSTVGNAIQYTGAGPNATRFQGVSIYELLEVQAPDYVRAHIGKWHACENHKGPVDGVGPNLQSSLTIYHRPVEYAHANYFAGVAGNLGPPPGIIQAVEHGDPIDETCDHTVFAWCVHDDRENPRPFTGHAGGPYEGLEDQTFDLWYTAHDAEQSNALVYTVDAARQVILDAAEDEKQFKINCWFHAAHGPERWTGDLDGVDPDRNMDEFGLAHLSGLGYHRQGATPPPGKNIGPATKAMVESVDTAIGKILDAMTPAQAARTMVVYVSDNGTTAGALTPSYDTDGVTPIMDLVDNTKMAVPESSYSPQHSKRSPWEGGIGAAGIIYGPAVVDPGDGVTPRVWDGLCGIEDLFNLECRWMGITPTDPVGYHTTALRDAVSNESSTGRSVYYQIAFQNTFHDNPFSTGQAAQIRFISLQNDDAIKVLWARVGDEQLPSTDPPTPDGISASSPITWLWQVYDMKNDPLEENDLFWDSGSFADPTDYEAHTVQDRYDALPAAIKEGFNECYLAAEADGHIPPGMTVVLS